MPIKFVLEVPTSTHPLAAVPPEEPALESYRINNPGNCYGATTGGRAYVRPGYWSSKMGIPTPDDIYSETDNSNPICGFLGEDDPSFFETRAAFLYAWMNGRSFQWSQSSFTIALLLIVGPGFRFASFLTYTIILVVGAWTSPVLVDQFELTRGDEFGDFLVRFTWALWTISAALFAVSRCCYRRDGFPWQQSASFPNYLINDKLPDSREPDYDQIVWFLWSWSMLGALFVFLAIHTILGQLYVARNWWFGVLLLVLCAYEFLAALGDIAQCGSPFGIPRGWARWLRVVRALVVVPTVFIFSGWVVFVSNPLW